MQDLEAIVSEAAELEALPQSVLRLTSLLAAADWSLEEITHTIRHDQALSGRLLRLANSASKGGRHQITSVSDAFLRVGPGPVLTLALASAVREEMLRPLESYGLREGVLWRHSVTAAIAVDNARTHCAVKPPPECFVAALVHDVGKLVLDRHLRNCSSEEVKNANRPPLARPSSEIEACACGVSHDWVSGMVAAQWNLPGEVAQAIALHHFPQRAPDVEIQTLASFVALADCVAHRIGEPCSDECHDLPEGVANSVGISQQGLKAMCEATQEHLEHFMKDYV